MSYITWSRDLETGNSLIDHDHKKLIEMVDRLYQVMQEGRAKDVIHKVLGNLVSYTRDHFHREEELMRSISYAGYDEHKHEHEKLLGQVNDLQGKLHSGMGTLSIEVLHFLRDWLVHHIGKSDITLAEVVRKQSSAVAV